MTWCLVVSHYTGPKAPESGLAVCNADEQRRLYTGGRAADTTIRQRLVQGACREDATDGSTRCRKVRQRRKVTGVGQVIPSRNRSASLQSWDMNGDSAHRTKDEIIQRTLTSRSCRAEHYGCQYRS